MTEDPAHTPLTEAEQAYYNQLDEQGVGKVGGGWSDVRGCRRVGAGAARPGR